MRSFERKSLAQIVVENPLAAPILEKYQLDFCCHGKQTLLDACDHNEEKFLKVAAELKQSSSNTMEIEEIIHFDKMTLSELIDYIVGKHHHYVRTALPHIRLHLQKIENKHGLRHPGLSEVLRQFDQLSLELENHLFKEEEIVFPRIKIIDEIYFSNRDNIRPISLRMIADPIEVMKMEHEIAGNIMAIIRKLTDDYTPPADACSTFKVTYQELRGFEMDLHQHVHLENNILYPKAYAMMDKLTSMVHA